MTWKFGIDNEAFEISARSHSPWHGKISNLGPITITRHHHAISRSLLLRRHWMESQTLSGSAYGTTSLMITEPNGVEFKGEPKVYKGKSDSGADTQRWVVVTPMVLWNSREERSTQQRAYAWFIGLEGFVGLAGQCCLITWMRVNRMIIGVSGRVAQDDSSERELTHESIFYSSPGRDRSLVNHLKWRKRFSVRVNLLGYLVLSQKTINTRGCQNSHEK